MGNRINVAELLKDCPKGMELDCTIFDTKVIYQGLNERIPSLPIVVQTEHGFEFELTQYGQTHNIVGSKCVIFPKGKDTWEGFHRPFKDGEILSNDICICLYNGNENDKYYGCYVGVGHIDYPNYFINQPQNSYFTKVNSRLATEEEKQKLFKAIKDNGYKWNTETKTIERLSPSPKKFDISTLIPFESRVLVRDEEYEKWFPAMWGFYDKEISIKYPYQIVGATCFSFCIPYEGNESLLGTKDDCDEFFKTWE